MTSKYFRATLGRLHGIKEQRFKGDYGASDALIDLERAYVRAGLTERQEQAIRLVYVDELIREEAGAIMGISHQTVSQHLDESLRKMAGTIESEAD